ncbi:MAG: hypothetical protein AAB844_00025, partial [Patescibacteria group bacterium]
GRAEVVGGGLGSLESPELEIEPATPDRDTEGENTDTEKEEENLNETTLTLWSHDSSFHIVPKTSLLFLI